MSVELTSSRSTSGSPVTPPERRDQAISLWLDHAAVVTADLARSIDFYTRIIGLRVHLEEEDPLRRGRRRAMLFDSQGRDVVELIEMSEYQHRSVMGRGSVHHLGFRFPEQDWEALRERLEAHDHAYWLENDILFVRDVDGLLIEVTRF